MIIVAVTSLERGDSRDAECALAQSCNLLAWTLFDTLFPLDLKHYCKT